MAAAVSSSRRRRLSRDRWWRRANPARADRVDPAPGRLGRIGGVRQSRGACHESQRMATAEELAALVRTLEDPDGHARGRAGETLIRLRDHRATPFLIEALDSDD